MIFRVVFASHNRIPAAKPYRLHCHGDRTTILFPENNPLALRVCHNRIPAAKPYRLHCHGDRTPIFVSEPARALRIINFLLVLGLFLVDVASGIFRNIVAR